MSILYVNQVVGPLFEQFIDAHSEGDSYAIFTGNIVNSSYDRQKIVPSISYSKSNFVFRIVTWLLFSLHLLVYLFMRHKDYDTVVITSNSPFNSFAIYFLSYIFPNINYDYMIYDIYPDVINYKYPSASLKSALCFWEFVERKVVERSRLCFSLSDDMTKAIDKRLAVKSKCITLPMVASLRHRNRDKADYRAMVEDHLGVRLNKYVLIYAGNLGSQHSFDNLVKVLSKKNLEDEVSLLVFGEGDRKKAYQGYAKGSKNISIQDFQNDQDFESLMYASDIAIVGLSGGFGSTMMPSKAVSYLSFGLPILLLSDQANSLADMIISNNLGWVVDTSEESCEEFTKSLVDKSLDFPSFDSVQQYFRHNNTIDALKDKFNDAKS